MSKSKDKKKKKKRKSVDAEDEGGAPQLASPVREAESGADGESRRKKDDKKKRRKKTKKKRRREEEEEDGERGGGEKKEGAAAVVEGDGEAGAETPPQADDEGDAAAKRGSNGGGGRKEDMATTGGETNKKDKKKKKKDEKDRKKRKKDKKKKRKRGGSSGGGEAEGDGRDSADEHGSSTEFGSKKRKRNGGSSGGNGDADDAAAAISKGGNGDVDDDVDETRRVVGGRVVASSASDYLPRSVEAKAAVSDGTKHAESDADVGGVTLLLFYQYVEPPWDRAAFQKALHYVEESGREHGLTGRMRVAREGLNCTLTGTYGGVRGWCRDLRSFGERGEFKDTEFKLTDHLPRGQLFPKLHAFKVDELVNYGLAGERAPPIDKTGVHLEPDEYHRKIAEKDTVIIDVRNHYEANIGQFVPPPSGAAYVDPGMRKSTEFPVWLDRPETKEKLRGKQVLMYCTGGVRCERASALLKQKMETEPDTGALGIKGVYQLQGGIDKYFKEFPDGGWWRGKNYVFDKRFAHAPPAVEGRERAAKLGNGDGNGAGAEAAAKAESKSEGAEAGGEDDNGADNGGANNGGAVDSRSEGRLMGECEACHRPWDMYRGKRRCPTCGVPSLVCRECAEADAAKVRVLGRDVRCDLCVREGVTSKAQLRERERRELEEYERKLAEKRKNEDSASLGGGDEKNANGAAGTEGDLKGHSPQSADHEASAPSNPGGVTRLFLKNMCARRMDEATLTGFLPGITHIQWITDRKTGKFYGSAFVEMATPEDAARAVSMDGRRVLGRPLRVKYQRADPKDVWPPRHCAVGMNSDF